MIPSGIAGHTFRETAYAFGILLASFVIAKAFSAVLVPLLSRFTSRTKTRLDDYLLAAVKGPLTAIIFLQGVLIALTAMTLTNAYQDYINEGWKAACMAVVFWALQRLASAFLNWYGTEVASKTQTDWDDHFLPIIRRTCNFGIVAVGALVILAQIGIQISPLLAGLGIGGLAIALALQPTLSNFFSGTYVLSDGSIRAGDYVEVQGGPTGTISEVGWRVTRIISADNNLVTIPNSKLSDSIITNFSQPDLPVNVVVPCGVSYESDLVTVERACLEVMMELQGRLSEVDKNFAPLVRFNQFADSNVNFNLVMRAIHQGGTLLIRHELIKALHARFATEEIEMNYPVRKLVLPKNGASTLAKGARKPGTRSASIGLFDTDGSDADDEA